MRKINAIILSAAALTGCQTTGGTKHEGAYRSTGPVPRVEDPEAMRALSEAADRASKSLRLLASAKSAEAQRKVTPAAHERMVRAETSVPPGWERLTKLDYTGAGNLLIRRLTTSAGYRFQASLRSRERFWDIRVPKIDSIFDNSLVPRPSWSPGVPPQHRKLVAATHRSPI